MAQQAEFVEDVSTITTMISEAQEKLKSAPEPRATDSIETLQQQLSEHRVCYSGQNIQIVSVYYFIRYVFCYINTMLKLDNIAVTNRPYYS